MVGSGWLMDCTFKRNAKSEKLRPDYLIKQQHDLAKLAHSSMAQLNELFAS